MFRLWCLLTGYAFGMLQTAYFLGRAHGIDIRKYGSGNLGTTNVMRTLGKKWGILTFLGDFFKCAAAVLVSWAIFKGSHPDVVPLLTVYTGAGVILTIILIINRIIYPDIPLGWSSTMCAMVFLFGIVLMVLGIIGEYLGKIILILNNTPQYIIRETRNLGHLRPAGMVREIVNEEKREDS